MAISLRYVFEEKVAEDAVLVSCPSLGPSLLEVSDDGLSFYFVETQEEQTSIRIVRTPIPRGARLIEEQQVRFASRLGADPVVNTTTLIVEHASLPDGGFKRDCSVDHASVNRLRELFRPWARGPE
jgi:hypothetical protein